MTSDAKDGFFLVVKENTIDRIVENSTGVPFESGALLGDYIAEDARERFIHGMETARKHGACYGMDLPFSGGEERINTRISLVHDEGRFFVLGEKEPSEVTAVEQMLKLNNRQINETRKRSSPSPDEKAFEEMGKLNSELISIRRRLEQKNEALRLAHRTDFLTGLPNRRAFFQDYEDLTPEEAGTLLMLDFNHFKEVNDHFGHDRGDETLKRFAKTLKSEIDKHEEVYRIGGDEFLVVLHTTPPATLKRAIDDIETELKNLHDRLSIAIGEVDIEAGRTLDGKHLRRLLSTADRRMYAHKKTRRQEAPDAGRFGTR